jgi:hypothetical protein
MSTEARAALAVAEELLAERHFRAALPHFRLHLRQHPAT